MQSPRESRVKYNRLSMKHVGNFDFYSVPQLAFDKRGDERRNTVGQEQEQTVSFRFVSLHRYNYIPSPLNQESKIQDPAKPFCIRYNDQTSVSARIRLCSSFETRPSFHYAVT